MFADKYLEWIADPERDFDLIAEQYGKQVVLAMLAAAEMLKATECERFVLSPQVAELTAELMLKEKSFKKLSENITLPDEQFWLEWSVHASGSMVEKSYIRDKTGLKIPTIIKKCALAVRGVEMYKDQPSIHSAICIAVILTHDNLIGFGTAFSVHFDTGDITYNTTKEYVKDDISMYVRYLTAAIAVINTPRIFERKPSDLIRLNKLRIKGGKAPLLEYIEIGMPADVAKELQAGRDAARLIDPHAGKKKRHRVHTFARIRLGNVEIVRPHWRGSAALGYSDPTLIVKRHGEHVTSEGHSRKIIR